MGQLVTYCTQLRQNQHIDQSIVDSVDDQGTVQFHHIKDSNHWKQIYRLNNRFGFVFIPWIGSKISYGYVNPGYDTISTRFSGCYMARIFGMGRQQYEVYHIHKGGGSGYVDQKENWNNHIDYFGQNFPNLKGSIFMPDIRAHGHNSLPQNHQLWGIISDTGDCFSLLIERNITNGIQCIFKSFIGQYRNHDLKIP